MERLTQWELLPGCKGVLANVAVMLVVQGLAVVLSLGLESLGFSEAAVVIVFVLGVLLTAVLTVAPHYCLAASVLSILCFNYFLVDPRLSFRIAGENVPGTIAVMFAVALLASYLVTQMRQSAKASAEAALVAQNEQLRANLLRSVSHDLRTPLTAISGNADILLDSDVPLSESERRQMLQDMYDDATWLRDVVENLLAITRLEDGALMIDKEVELLDDIVEEALRHVSRDASRHEIRTVYADELLLVCVNPSVMVQVVVNLVNNAIMHTPDGSQICITLRRDGPNACLSVADDGAGIPDDEKDRVFTSGNLHRRSVVDGQRGIGLGLSLCRSIVEAHGGTLGVCDAEPHGSVFTVTLPLGRMPEHDEL